MKDQGVKSVYILNDKQVYGQGIAKNTEAALGPTGIKVAGRGRLGRQGVELPRAGGQDQGHAARTPSSPAGSSRTTAPSSTRTSARRCPTRSCSAPTAWPPWTFTKELPADVQTQTYLTVPTRGPGRAAARRARSSTRTTRPSTARSRTRSPRTRCTATRRWLDVLDAIAKGGDDRQGRHRRLLRDQEDATASLGHVRDRRRRRHDADRPTADTAPRTASSCSTGDQGAAVRNRIAPTSPGAGPPARRRST